MCDYDVKLFIARLYNTLLAPDLCDQLFSVITLMNSVHTCLFLFFSKGFCTVFFIDNKHNAVTLLCSAQIRHVFLVKMKEKSKSQNQIPKKKVSLGLFH